MQASTVVVQVIIVGETGGGCDLEEYWLVKLLTESSGDPDKELFGDTLCCETLGRLVVDSIIELLGDKLHCET